ncbi:glycan biosynthesis hexose transferase WsfD [Paenibacillus soyae]|uniref:Uncharacterized protein n=1 Tax=Paenibacillus soyae TaxID=2969249 RepID=A0A9X2MS77_9BACL|nr:hypothetical protein [Paenibacillus soyae]MCR2805916.1 hypothetical protein [Paenibacillus soyae]
MKKWLTVENGFLLAAAGIVISLLLAGTFVGVADNGDFLRIMGSIGLDYYEEEPYEDRFFRYAHSLFAYDAFFRGFYPSTQLVLVVVARSIGYLLNGEAFDVRVLGAIYAVILIAAGYVLVKLVRTRSLAAAIALALLLLFVFFDIGYLAYFNSLFGEPVSMVFLLLTMALGLYVAMQEKPSRRALILFSAAALFLIGSKTQNAPVGVGFALLGLRYAWLRDDKPWRRLALSLSALTLLLSVATYALAPKDFKDINTYQTVFFGILKDSPDVEGDLKELGLPARLSVLAGTNYFQADTAIKQNDPSLKADFYDRISHADVLLFYMKHPGRLIDKLEYAAKYSMIIRPYYLGNFEKAEGKPPGALTYKYSGWSEFKKHEVPSELWFIALFFVLYFALAAWEWAKRKDMRSRTAVELFVLFGLTGAFSFAIPILGDGAADIAKHLFLFNAVFDMMAVSMAVWLIYRVVHLINRNLKAK